MSVEFSVSEINLVNPCNNQGAPEKKQKVTYYVQSRFGYSIKVRAALSKNSHPVRWTVVTTALIYCHRVHHTNRTSAC